MASIIVDNIWHLDEITLTLLPDIVLWIQTLTLQPDQEDNLVCWMAKGRYFDSKKIYREE